MQLTHIKLDQLIVSPVNMRGGRKQASIKDILPSVKKRGILTPLLVRPNGADGMYEIVAGKRRYLAAKAAELSGPLPCAILEEGDDADALEASLIENLARLDPDPMTEFEAFARLAREGRSVEDIAATFAVSPALVRQRLALGNLAPKIRIAYRAGKIDAESVRYLTLATEAQQSDWLALFENPDERTPRGRALKRWLFGGEDIGTSAALFDLDTYPGRIVTDLFGDTAYFDDAESFWSLQNAAIAERKAAYLADGWAGVRIFGPEDRYERWNEHEVAKSDGGHIVIEVHSNGEVSIHEGRLSQRDYAKKIASERSEDGKVEQTAKPEITQTMSDYLALHRRAMVGAELLNAPGVALRLAVAHLITGSGHWNVRPDPERAPSEAVAASVQASKASAALATARETAAEALGLPFVPETLIARPGSGSSLSGHFRTLLALDDATVLSLLALLMAESLEAGGEGVEAAGCALSIDPATWWTPDTVFASLLRDREAVDAILAELGGETVATANLHEKLKTKKAIIEAYFTGEVRDKTEGWTPRYFAFPMASYTSAGAGRFEAVSQSASEAMTRAE